MNSLYAQYREVRRYTEKLMAPLSPEDHLAQPAPEVSPPKWHLGHTTWFFETLVLQGFSQNYQPFHPQFSFLFNSYYQSLGKRLPREMRGQLIRPALDEVYRYRRHVDRAIEKLWATEPPAEAQQLLELGLHHEQQHQELFLTDFKRILAGQSFDPVYDPHFGESQSEAPAQWISFEGGLCEIGHYGKSFAYDNENPRHPVYLQAFAISSALVTNGEWLQFMEAGGYRNAQWWHDEGWAWCQSEKLEAPLYWLKHKNQWQRLSLAGWELLEDKDPVAHLSYYEAYAYAQWKGLRLPTEAEWEVASAKLNWGQRWEWTESAYLPYPGFEPMQGAAQEYNGKFMINQMVLRGASVATSPGHKRATYRNFFHPAARWQFTGLRLAKNL